MLRIFYEARRLSLYSIGLIQPSFFSFLITAINYAIVHFLFQYPEKVLHDRIIPTVPLASICVYLSRFGKREKGSDPFSLTITTTNRETVKESMIEKKIQRISNHVTNKVKHHFKFFPKRKSTAPNHLGFDCRGKNDLAL